MGKHSAQIQFQTADFPSCFILGPNDVHVWWGSLTPEDEPIPVHLPDAGMLSKDEIERMNRFYFERDRLRYKNGRAALRKLLGGYLNQDPKELEFEYSPQGKPGFAAGDDGRGIQFNLSNSDNRVLYIFSLQRLVGIDLELLHPMADEDDFARQFFCPSECELLRAQTGLAKQALFFELWTCKEALLKGMGAGLTRPINEVEIELSDGGPRLVSIAGVQSMPPEWQLRLFEPAPGYQAALAVQGENWNPTYYNLPL